MESKLLNTSHVNKLGEWLKEINKLGEYKLCWDSQKDSNGFGNGCSGKNDTITLIMNENNSSQVIGAFTDMEIPCKYIFL